MKYFVEGLPKKQIKVFKAPGPHMAPKGFYLAGGTALAIHYGHRLSVDPAWFTPEPFQDGMLLAQALRNSSLDLEIEKKFGIRDIGSVLNGLVYFDDAENERMPRMLWNVNWREIKKQLWSG